MDVNSLDGTTLDGRYAVVRMIGRGGMGEVYEAQHTGTGRRVAIKVISSTDLSRDASLVGRFQREAKAAGAIDSQHIAQVLDTGTDGATKYPFMVMEFLGGEDLQQTVQRIGPLRPEVALRVVAQACVGLARAHEAGVVHRDIKPANLFLSRKDQGEVLVKLLDFGIAKVKMDHASSTENAGLTRTGSMLGSPLYMSPEQARGLKDIDHRADIWSLGVVLYQALCGRTPFHHIEALGELIISITHEIPPPVQDFAPWCPPEVAAIVHGALRADRASRYQTANDLLDAIKPLLPYGWSVFEDMISPMTDQERGYLAARYTDAAAPPPRAIASLPPPRFGSVPPPSMTPGVQPAMTHSGFAQSQSQERPKKKSAAGIAVAAAVVIGASGFGAVKLFGAPPPVAPSAVAAATPPPQAAPTAAAPAVVAPANPSQRMVKLVILPEDAAVEIDGLPTTPKNGVVEITGQLGSVHRVRLSIGKLETLDEIIVTEAGAMPPKIELDRKAAAAGGGAKPKTTAAATAAAATPPATPTPPGGLEHNFE